MVITGSVNPVAIVGSVEPTAIVGADESVVDEDEVEVEVEVEASPVDPGEPEPTSSKMPGGLQAERLARRRRRLR